MAIIHNPIIPGMAPDPSIIRVGNDYYLATSTFHWTPAVQIFHSTDLANWQLTGYALDHGEVNLRGTNTPAGIWAPHLSYDPATKRFWLAYSHMQNMAGREFNSDSFAVWSDSINGPWSKPIYLTSIGFDPALFHDDDGRHYVSILEWETRTGYQAPGHIVVAEVNLDNGGIIGDWHRVTTGFTTRGCAEAPQLYKHDGYYYLLIAAGGTGYAHGVEIGRAKDVFGPYTPHPSGEPIITSSPHHLFSLGDPDAGHFEMQNPNSPIQKSGHGSLVSTPNGDWYIAHLMSRPLPGTSLNPLGRETSLQKMTWSNDGWLQMADGSNLAKATVPAPSDYPDCQQRTTNFDIDDHFETDHVPAHFMTPYREQTNKWVNTTERPGYLRIYGDNSFFSQVDPAIMATRATSLDYTVQTKLEFHPIHYSQTAGLGLYYDANNWLYARLCQDDTEDHTVLHILQAKLGQRTDDIFTEVPVTDGTVELQLRYHLGFATISYRLDSQADWQLLAQDIDVTYLSDEGVNGEPGEIGGFTGLFNFIGAVDAYQHQSFADFSNYSVKNNHQRMSNMPKTTISLKRLVPGLIIGPASWLGPYIAMNSLFLPALLQHLDAANKVNLVALFSTCGMIVAAISNMVAGMLSDRTKSRFGKRAPWIVGGSLVFMLAMILASFATNIPYLLTAWMVGQAALNFIVAPMVAWIDFAAKDNRGTASSAYGGLGMALGNNGFNVVGAMFLGQFRLGFIIFGIFTFIGTLIAVLIVHEPSNVDDTTEAASTPEKEKFSLKELTSVFPGWSTGRDYYLALIGKLFQGVGNFAVTGYILYIMTDFLHRGSQTQSSIQLINTIMLVFGILMGFIAGPLSDKFKVLKWPVGLSTIFLAIGAIALFLLRDNTGIIIYAFMAGIGMGVWNSLDNLLNLEVIPDPDRVAFFLGVYNLGNTVTQAIAPVIAALVISLFGFSAIFIVSFVFSLVGGISMLCIRSVKR